ncbi:hypothetical protein EKO27_g4050 [Xylaria grammica]|uniref:Uncharacterized protein n=1 Tax=Xylaria grammica TaxID=363999 RepID=A0A439D9K0_9PEZI|nr:hypothetical protein EKO27_g4050 [Xylaria grammica]
MEARSWYYTEDEADDLEELAMEASDSNLEVALLKLKAFFDTTGLNYALQGGYAMRLQGFLERKTYDLDVTTDARPPEIIDALKSNEENVNGEPIRYHEKVSQQLGVGGAVLYVDVSADTTRMFVHVDLLLAGDVLGARHISSAEDKGGYKVLSISALFDNKLTSYNSRGADKDYDDLVWMFNNKRDEIENSVRDSSEEHRYRFLDRYAEDNDDDGVTRLEEFLGL